MHRLNERGRCRRPHHFTEITQASRVSSSYINHYKLQMPYWLHETLRAVLFDQDYSPSKQERMAAKNYLRHHGGTGSNDEVNGLLSVCFIQSKGFQARALEPAWAKL